MTTLTVNLLPWRQYRRYRQWRIKAGVIVLIMLISVSVTLASRQFIHHRWQLLYTRDQQDNQEYIHLVEQTRQAEARYQQLQVQYAHFQAKKRRQKAVHLLAMQIKDMVLTLPAQVWFQRIESTSSQLTIEGQTQDLQQFTHWYQTLAKISGGALRLTHLDHKGQGLNDFTLLWRRIDDKSAS